MKNRNVLMGVSLCYVLNRKLMGAAVRQDRALRKFLSSVASRR